MRSLQSHLSERVMYYFNKETVPKNHIFIRQGDVMPGDIYFVWEGSVESYSVAPDGGFRRRGIMLKGSIFGALPAHTPAPYTITATSSPCEVLRVKYEFRKHVPECVLASMRENVDAQQARRVTQCPPLVRMSPEVSKLSRPSSSSSSGSFSGSMRPGSRGNNRRCLVPNTPGLFKRIVTDVDYKVFQLTPGESLAMTGERPRRREKLLGVSGSAPALPNLRSG